MIRRISKGTNTTAQFLTTLLLILMFLITIAFTPNLNLQAQNTRSRYVATNGTDMGNTCTNSDNPCRTIAHAIGLAVSGDIVDIDDGIYTEPDGLVINKSLTLQGAGQDNITIIQAHEEPEEATSRVITIDGEYEVEITDLTIRHGNTTSNGGGVLNQDDATLSLTNVTFSRNTAKAGGGMLNVNSDATLTNVLFLQNRCRGDDDFVDGGGMHNNNASLSLTNVEFNANTCGDVGDGGGLWNGVNSSTVTLANVTFIDNVARLGGGMLNNRGNPTLTNVDFIGNSAEIRGGGMFNEFDSPTLTDVTFQGNSALDTGLGNGGGMDNRSGNPMLENVLFEENHAAGTEQDRGGGGMFNENGDPVLKDVTFTGNTAVHGGGIRINGGEAELRNVHFQNNTADSWGGGMYVRESSPELVNVVFAGNEVTDFGGGGMYVRESSPELINVVFAGNGVTDFGGGGMYNDGGSSTLTNVTFSGNNAGNNAGGGLYNLTGTSILTNTIAWGNSAGTSGSDEIFNDIFATANISHSLISGGCPLNTSCSELITTDPLFVDPTDPDGIDDIFGTPDDGLILQNLSPAINSGDPGTDLSLFPGGPDDPVDLAGESRVFPGNTEIIDMGAYEFQGDGLEFATSVELSADAGEGWRMLTSPVTGETYNGLLGGEDGLWTQGVTGARFSGGDPNVYRFDQATFDWDPDVVDLDEEIVPGNGFIVYVFEDDDYDGPEEGEFPKFLESTGDWLDLDGSFSYSDLGFNNDDPDNSYFLLGNPHPIPLDFCEFTAGNIATSIDIWDPAKNSSEGAYVTLSCTGGDDVQIAPFQAFWVRTTDTSPSLEIPEEAYLGGTIDGYFKESSKDSKSLEDVPLLSFTVGNTDDTFTNTARILLSENASAGLDEQDGLKRSPAGLAQRWLSFYSMDADGRAYAFQNIPRDVQDKVSIPLDIQTTESGSFNLMWELPEQAWSYYLRDNQSGEVMELREGGRYRFEIEADIQPFQGSKPWKSLEGAAALIQPSDHFKRSDGSGDEPRFELLITAKGVDGLAELGDLPETFELGQNYPNPFNPSTVIRYQLPASSEVRLEVYDMLGRRVATLVDEQVAAGRHQVNFDAGHLSSGVYLYRLTARGTNGANQIFTKKLTLIK